MPRKLDPADKLNRLYNRSIWILNREIEAIYDLSMQGKLSDTHGRHLRDYMKLLKELKTYHKEQLIEDKDKAKKLTEAELEAIALKKA